MDRLGNHDEVNRVVPFTIKPEKISGNLVFLGWHLEISTCTTFLHESSHAHEAPCVFNTCVFKVYSPDGYFVRFLTIKSVSRAGLYTDATTFGVTKPWSVVGVVGFERSISDYRHESLSRSELGRKEEAAKAKLAKTSGDSGMSVRYVSRERFVSIDASKAFIKAVHAGWAGWWKWDGGISFVFERTSYSVGALLSRRDT